MSLHSFIKHNYVSGKGATIHTVNIGSPDGIPTLMIHGLGGNWANWLPCARLLGAYANTTIIDLPGFGRSSAGQNPCSVEHYVDTVSDFIHSHFDRPILLLGSSMGALISSLVAAKIPKAISHLVLSGPALPRWKLGHAHPRDLLRAFAMLTPILGERFLLREWTVRSPENQLTQVFHDVLVNPATVPLNVWQEILFIHSSKPLTLEGIRPFLTAFRSVIPHVLNRTNNLKLLRSLSQPIFLAHGTHDKLIPVDSARYVVKQLSHIHYVEYDQTGHMPHLESSQRFSKDLLSWLSLHKLIDIHQPSGASCEQLSL